MQCKMSLVRALDMAPLSAECSTLSMVYNGDRTWYGSHLLWFALRMARTHCGLHLVWLALTVACT